MTAPQDLLKAGPLLAIEAALLTRLRQGFPERLATGRRGFHLEPVPAEFNLAEAQRLFKQAPCVLLGWTGVTPDANAGAWVKGAATWTVYLVTQSSAGPIGRYRGDTLAPGLFGMIQVAMPLLQGFTIPDAGSVGIGAVTSLYAEGWGDTGHAIAAIQISVPFTMWPAPEDGAELDAFLRLAADWRFDAQPDAPADARAGASDLIDVRGAPA